MRVPEQVALPRQNLNINIASWCFLKAGPVLARNPVRGMYLGGDLRKCHRWLKSEIMGEEATGGMTQQVAESS